MRGSVSIPSPPAGEGVIASAMTDEGYGVSHPPVPLAATLEGFLRNTPYPTFADAKATFPRKGGRKECAP
jgi:hypothetical protein